MRVRDIMTSTHLAVARAGDELALAAQMMLWTDAHHLPVVADDGTVVGVLSARDLLRQPKEESGVRSSHVTVEEVMSYPPVTVAPDTPLPSAADIMLDRKIGCLPVVEGGALLGVLTTADLLRNQLDRLIDRPAARLPPTVRELMKPAPAVVMRDNEVFDAAALMGNRRIRHLPVVDHQRRVVGILSDRDVRVALGDPRRFLSDPDERERVRATLVEQVMSRDVVTVRADAPVTTAIDQLTHERVGALPVVAEDGKLLGMLSYLDVIQALEDRL